MSGSSAASAGAGMAVVLRSKSYVLSFTEGAAPNSILAARGRDRCFVPVRVTRRNTRCGRGSNRIDSPCSMLSARCAKAGYRDLMANKAGRAPGLGIKMVPCWRCFTRLYSGGSPAFSAKALTGRIRAANLARGCYHDPVTHPKINNHLGMIRLMAAKRREGYDVAHAALFFKISAATCGTSGNAQPTSNGRSLGRSTPLPADRPGGPQKIFPRKTSKPGAASATRCGALGILWTSGSPRFGDGALPETRKGHAGAVDFGGTVDAPTIMMISFAGRIRRMPFRVWSNAVSGFAV